MRSARDQVTTRLLGLSGAEKEGLHEVELQCQTLFHLTSWMICMDHEVHES
jgi:hypothetical protein